MIHMDNFGDQITKNYQNPENEREFLDRIQRLETAQFGGTKEENYRTSRKDTGRADEFSDETPQKDYDDYRKKYPKENETAKDEAKAISDEKTVTHHIGLYNNETITQELLSLMNTKTPFKNKEWWDRYGIINSTLTKSKKNFTDQQYLNAIGNLARIAKGEQIDVYKR